MSTVVALFLLVIASVAGVAYGAGDIVACVVAFIVGFAARHALFSDRYYPPELVEALAETVAMGQDESAELLAHEVLKLKKDK